MNPVPPQTFKELIDHPATRNYLILGCAGIAIYFLVMTEQAAPVGVFLNSMLALGGLFARWIISPVFFLLLTMYLLIDPFLQGMPALIDGPELMRRSSARNWNPNVLFEIENWILCASVLAYLIAQFRLYSLLTRSLPENPSFRKKTNPEAAAITRPLSSVDATELPQLIPLFLIVLLSGQLVWLVITALEYIFKTSRDLRIVLGFSRLIVFVFFLTVVFASIWTLLSYLRYQRMNQTEAELMLRDVVWQQTRREQERIQRWKRWFRKRHRSRKE